MAKRPPKKPLWIRIAGILVYSLVCLAAISIGALYSWVNQSAFMRQVLLSKLGIPPPAPAEVFQKDSINVLILGADEDRVYGRIKPIRLQARSDMMLLAKVDFKFRRITGVSIPRDTLVALPGYKEQKINGYHAIGAKISPDMGKQLAKQAVETLLSVPIDKVILVDYAALQDMVNLVGGVEIFVEKRMVYQDRAGRLNIDLQPGRQRLDGSKALGYVRFRKDIGSDFARQARQKQFLLAFKTALRNNIGMLPQVLNKAVQAMSGGLSEDEVNSLAHFAMAIGGDNIRLGQIPVVDAPGYSLRVDYGKLAATLAEYNLIGDASGFPSARLSYRR